jgi:hypothetical protein
VALQLLTPSHAGNLAADAADGNKAQPEGRHGEPLDLTPQRSHAQRYRGLVRTVECLLGLRPGRALAKNASAPESARGQPRRMLQPLQAASRPIPTDYPPASLNKDRVQVSGRTMESLVFSAVKAPSEHVLRSLLDLYLRTRRAAIHGCRNSDISSQLVI